MEDYRASARRRWQESQGPPAARGAAAGTAAPATGSREGAGASAARAAAAAGSAAPEAQPLEQVQAQWAALPEEQRRQILLAGAFLVLLLAGGARAVGLLAAAVGAFYLHGRLPHVGTFEPFFRDWFTQEYFPKVSQKLQRELQERAKNQNFLDAMASQFKGWVMGKTETLQAAAWYELAVRHYLPPAYTDWYFMRTATVNLGADGAPPSYVTFWGIHDRWMLSPLTHVDFESVSILDELERQQRAQR